MKLKFNWPIASHYLLKTCVVTKIGRWCENSRLQNLSFEMQPVLITKILCYRMFLMDHGGVDVRLL